MSSTQANAGSSSRPSGGPPCGHSSGSSSAGPSSSGGHGRSAGAASAMGLGASTSQAGAGANTERGRLGEALARLSSLPDLRIFPVGRSGSGAAGQAQGDAGLQSEPKNRKERAQYDWDLIDMVLQEKASSTQEQEFFHLGLKNDSFRFRLEKRRDQFPSVGKKGLRPSYERVLLEMIIGYCLTKNIIQGVPPNVRPFFKQEMRADYEQPMQKTNRPYPDELYLLNAMRATASKYQEVMAGPPRK